MFLKNKIFISILAGLIPSLITIGYKIFGPLIFFFSYFTPLPFFLVSIKYSFTNLMISIAISLSIIIVFSSTSAAILFFIINILPAIIISFEKYNNSNIYYGNIIAKITLLKCIIFLLASYFYSQNILDFSNKFYSNLQTLTKNNIFIDENSILMIPSIIISSWIIILVFNLIIARYLILKFYKKSYFNNQIINMQVPKWLSIIFLLLIITMAVLNFNIPWLTSIAIILSIPIAIQGLCVLHYVSKKISMGSFLLYSIYGIIFFVPISMSIIIAIGVLENLYNFRNLSYKINQSNID